MRAVTSGWSPLLPRGIDFMCPGRVSRGGLGPTQDSMDGGAKVQGVPGDYWKEWRSMTTGWFENSNN